MTINQGGYKSSHTGKKFGEKYDFQLFESGRFEHELWNEERKVLKQIISSHDIKGRYLDFACGTGRVISFLEGVFEKPIGADISPDMLEEASKKVKTAKLVVGDFQEDPGFIEGEFDCITSFRFFLNAEQNLRNDALSFLKTKLRDSRGVLIFNIHANKYSTQWFKLIFDKIFRNKHHNQLSFKEVSLMLDHQGLEIVEYHGLAFFHLAFYNLMPLNVWRFFERIARNLPFLKPFFSNLIFVCKVK